MATGGSKRRVPRIRTLVLPTVLLGGFVFALQGGEYRTTDLLRQRSRRARLVRQIDSLQRVVDSLVAYKRRVETDPALQERIAREQFGMVRGTKELLYRFAVPDDTASRPPH